MQSTKVMYRASATRDDGTTTWFVSLNGEQWHEVTGGEPTADDFATVVAMFEAQPFTTSDGKPGFIRHMTLGRRFVFGSMQGGWGAGATEHEPITTD